MHNNRRTVETKYDMLRAKKKYGQNFLKDDRILTQIVDAAEIDEKTAVIEIGPGLGALTEKLCQQAGFVLAYEIDRDLIPHLEQRFGSCKHFLLRCEDFLKVNIQEEIDTYLKEYETIAVVANLPYYITTPIIFKLLTSTSEISKYVLMMQKEVADRICGKPNTKDYNALSVAIAYRATAKKVLSVPKTAFIPQPNVESAVVRLDIDAIQKYFPKDERLFFDLIRLCFTQRRKTLLNNLSLKYSKEQVLRMLTDLGLSPQIRSEALQIEDFIRISDYLTQQAL